MGKSILTKVAKGIAFGDVSNQAVRNILTEITKRVKGSFTEQEMYDTLDYFNWRCPYTDKDLRPLIEGKLGGYATDHVYSQDREWCGLNVKGNLIIVDNVANREKGNLSVDEFLLNNTSVLGDLDIKTRKERLQKIKDFQKHCDYDPIKVSEAINQLMKDWYNKVRSNQEECVEEALKKLSAVGINPLIAKGSVTTKSKKSSSVPQIIFYSSSGTECDQIQFKDELLKTKSAHFDLTYADGSIKNSQWKADKFDIDSSIKSNIQSRPFWRRKELEGLVKVEVYID